MHFKTTSLLYIVFLCAFTSCSSTKNTVIQPAGSIRALRYLDEKIIAFNQPFQNTSIGGLSGIDYNEERNEYYLVSDDRSAINPARFYTATISIANSKIDTVLFIGVNFLLQQNGNNYAGNKQDPLNTPDPEALRYNKKTKEAVWTSEGERIVKQGGNVLSNPSINRITLSGKHIDTIGIPYQLHTSPTDYGPRQNGVFEGLAFSGNYRSLYVSVEEPLYQDGPRAGLKDTTAWVRILKYNVVSKKPVAQYAYRLDPVAHAPLPANAFKVNGIPDILNIDKNKLLVIERSYSTGRLACTIKLYIADLSEASDVSAVASLAQNQPLVPVKKQLLLNMDTLGIFTDNIEGVTFGPTLPNGNRTLIFVSDNNFSPLQRTQVLLFEVIP